jgi:hypothetical protein
MQMGKHNTSENGRSAWVAVCAYPTHIDTDTTVSEEHTVYTFSPEDGDSMCFRNVGIYLDLYCIKTQNTIIIIITATLRI